MIKPKKGMEFWCINEPWKCYAKWNRPETEIGQNLYEVPRIVKFIKTKYNGGYQEERGYCLMGTEFQTGDLGTADESTSPPHHHTKSKTAA